ncbi:SPOR domain-containing protein [Deinococcus soli (ex Cha et al. 2016)]|uniref:Cell division septation protein DedD n=2 Tax=Deinococcus soli (ex Cha et al. 2016) TaxID=1309411 RepID=A0ACC6KAN1_9DEIO|nr:SPOR domain-containing protein [Deinococcus soli (ex Cha et al. 2016)]MDR6216467.1 cell division septation protein DedD [Deinococcus soli (ex Cha et al. 2016)]MDR6327288.1 cell division septation protein DedD [Deinococcus soli (ex Cha et al. 2016)]MDR6749563.1 cell division septation protein DedD [Deinococcus soli (ex Cha et al. 2016)]
MSRAAGPRRWPDLMIGALVLLLLGGFGTLLLRPQPGAQGSVPATETSPAPTTDSAIPGAPGSDSAGSEGAVGTEPITPPATPTPGAPPTTDSAAGNTPAGASTSEATTAETSTVEAPVIAAAPIGTPDPALTGAAPAPATSADPDADPSTGEAAGAAPTDAAPAARTGGAVPTSEQRTPLRSDYRITLGTFSSGAAAQQAAQGVSALGYTVYPIDVAAGVVAQVGPFADESTAREALADVQRAYPGAVLYPPRDRSLSTPSTPAATTGATTDTAQTAPAEPATPAPAATTPTYLQVGAFDRLESAQNLVQQLRDLGYNPTVNAPSGKKVTVLVGPYTGDPLTRTETRLRENGLDSFRVR